MADVVLLADTSAWFRSGLPAVSAGWTRALVEDAIATTPPVRAEVLFSARSPSDYVNVSDELDALIQLPCEGSAWSRALEVQAALARQGGLHHRSVAIPDLVIAAVAELNDVAVWHYDRDYDRIAAITGQPTQWIAPPGSL